MADVHYDVHAVEEGDEAGRVTGVGRKLYDEDHCLVDDADQGGDKQGNDGHGQPSEARLRIAEYA